MHLTAPAAVAERQIELQQIVRPPNTPLAPLPDTTGRTSLPGCRSVLLAGMSACEAGGNRQPSSHPVEKAEWMPILPGPVGDRAHINRDRDGAHGPALFYIQSFTFRTLTSRHSRTYLTAASNLQGAFAHLDSQGRA